MPKDWWKNFFQEEYLKVWEAQVITPDRTRKESKFLVDVLKLKRGMKVLDLCCGQGRHAILLAKKGLDVTGVDYSNYLLSVAKKRAKKERAKVNFIKQDVRKLNLKDRFDVVLNLFTAFGYGSDEDNKKIIKNVAAVLKPGGYFLLDLPNIVFILKNYKSEIFRETDQGSSYEENKFDAEKFVNITKHTLCLKDGRRMKRRASVRHYSFPEIKILLVDSGLVVKGAWGSFDKNKFSIDTKRMIILSKKITK